MTDYLNTREAIIVRLSNLLGRLEETKDGYKITGTITYRDKSDLQEVLHVYKEWVEGRLVLKNKD